MTNFIKHMPCTNCGSKDNLAEYEDHYYCFGCSYWKGKNDLNSIRSRLSAPGHGSLQSNELNITTTTNIPSKAMQWLLQYELTTHDCETYGITWCADKELLVLVNTPTYYQGRNFGDGPKYLSKGDKPLLFYGNSDTLICVEDVLSAIRVYKADNNYTTTPLLGSSMPLKLTETILERFKKVRIWLDRDKAIEAIKMVRNLKQKGIDADVIISANDPKEYDANVIRTIIKERL